MTDYNTMNAQQCADWLAERDGWTLVDGETIAADDDDYFPEHWRNKDGRTSETHPMPLTLDAAAATLRKPWRLVSIQFNSVGWAFVKAYDDKACRWLEPQGPDRLTAEYRAAVAARMEDER